MNISKINLIIERLIAIGLNCRHQTEWTLNFVLSTGRTIMPFGCILIRINEVLTIQAALYALFNIIIHSKLLKTWKIIDGIILFT